MRRFLFLGSLAALLTSFHHAPAEIVYRKGEGVSTQAPGEEEIIRGKTSAAQFSTAEEYEKSGDTKKAISAYRYLLKKWPQSQTAARAQLKVATLSEKNGDFDFAFKAYGQYLAKYPHGEEFDRAVEAQFRIARLFLEGQKHKVLGLVPVSASPVRAQAMFEEIVKSAPYSKTAALAQFSIGRALEKQGKDLEAITAYQTVLVKYPNDSVAADAQYQIAYIYYQESRGSGDHATSTKAREAFDDFLAKHPDSEKAAQARDNMKSLTGRETRGTLDIAKFYDKKKNFKAAYIYYADVMKRQPGSPDAEVAKKRIEALKSSVGEDALRAGPERSETGKRAETRRRLQAKVETSARPDFAGPPVVVPDEIAPDKSPKLRTGPSNLGPVPAVEPPLPKQ